MLSFGIFAFVLTLDLLTKYFIFKLIPEAGQRKDVMPGFINFIHVENRGAAWGFMAGRPIFLIVVAIVILALYLTFFIIKLKHLKGAVHPLLVISAGLITGGCIGNLIDRVVLGYVRDFINFQFFNFPVFNFADIAVTASIVLMVIYLIFFYPKEGDSKKKPQKEGNTQENPQNKQQNSENNEIIVENEEKDVMFEDDKDEG